MSRSSRRTWFLFGTATLATVAAARSAQAAAAPVFPMAAISLQEAGEPDDDVDAILRASSRKKDVIHGKILGLDGEPLVSAWVTGMRVKRRAKTNAEGIFKLRGKFNATGVVSVALPGGESRAVALPPRDPVTGEREMLIWNLADPFVLRPAPTLDREAERKLARELLLSVLEGKTKAEGLELHSMYLALDGLAHLDPKLAIAFAREDPFGDSGWGDAGYATAVETLAAIAPQEALESLGNMERNWMFTKPLIAVAKMLGGEQEIELLMSHLVEIKEVENRSHKVVMFALLGSRLHVLGESEGAARAFKEATTLAKEFEIDGKTDYARGVLGELLAAFDLAEGLKWIKTTSETQRAGRLGRVARQIAEGSPKEAQEVLTSIGELGPLNLGRWTCGVAYRMAAVDPKRAHTVATRLDSNGYSTAMVALRLHELGKTDEAAEALANAATRQFDTSNRGRMRTFEGRLAVEGPLLAIAAKIDPGNMASYLGQAFAYHRSAAGDEINVVMEQIEEAALAYFLLDIDADLSAALLEPSIDTLVARLQGKAPELGFMGDEFVWPCLARLDPERAAKLAKELGVDVAARVGMVLALEPEERLPYVQRKWVEVWSPTFDER